MSCKNTIGTDTILSGRSIQNEMVCDEKLNQVCLSIWSKVRREWDHVGKSGGPTMRKSFLLLLLNFSVSLLVLGDLEVHSKQKLHPLYPSFPSGPSSRQTDSGRTLNPRQTSDPMRNKFQPDEFRTSHIFSNRAKPKLKNHSLVRHPKKGVEKK
jgi:hypothetical protein